MGRTLRHRMRHKHSNYKSSKTKIDDSIINVFKYLQKFGWKNESNLVCKFFPTGRGLYSKKRIVNNVLIRLPFKALVTLATIEEDLGFKIIFEENEHEMTLNILTFQSLLAVYVLYNKHIKVSPLNGYVNTIPKSFTNPIFCSREEYFSFPTNLLEETVETRKHIRLQYSFFQKVLRDVKCDCCDNFILDTYLSQNDFDWAYFAVNSRSIYIEPTEMELAVPNSFFKTYLKDVPQMGLAPFLDLFNHSDRATTSAVLSSKINKVTNEVGPKMYALHSGTVNKPYEEIFISYGSLTNLKLLFDYGFFLNKNVNDQFTITLSDIEQLIKTTPHLTQNAPIHRNKFKYIRDHNLHEQMFVNNHNGVSHNLQVVIYLLFNEPSHFPNVLHNVAYGCVNFSLTFDTTRLLLLLKKAEYENLKEGFESLPTLTMSGRMVYNYIVYCINYIQQCIDNFLL